MDKYDKQIKRLTKDPERISQDWRQGIGLFAHAKGKGLSFSPKCGCLTQIKGDPDFYIVDGRPDLTERICNDPRIPNEASLITVETLPVFAEWQRILDKELGRIEA